MAVSINLKDINLSDKMSGDDKISLSIEDVKSNELLKVFDKDEENNLQLYSYIKYNPDSKGNTNYSRGIIFNDDKLIFKGFNHTEEYHVNDEWEQIFEEKNIDLTKCNIYPSFEGTLIRMFYFENKWYISTYHKLNSYKSKWSSSKSFGEIFELALFEEYKNSESTFKTKFSVEDINPKNVLNNFKEFLDKDKQYVFLILNNEENRIVCIPDETQKIFHVATFDSNSLQIIKEKIDIGLNYPEKLNIDTIENLKYYVKNVDIKKLQGAIIFTESGSSYKIINARYYRYFETRGNEPSIKFRWLQVRMNPDISEDLKDLYPDYVTFFEDYENTIYDIAKEIFKVYMNRFIRKQFAKTNKHNYFIIKLIHSWHLENRDKNKISLEKVIDILNDQAPTILNTLIKKHKYDIKQLKNKRLLKPEETKTEEIKNEETKIEETKIEETKNEKNNVTVYIDEKLNEKEEQDKLLELCISKNIQNISNV